MIQKELVLENSLGLHARAAAKLVKLALSFQSEVWLTAGGWRGRVDAKSIISLMGLGAACGTRLSCRVSGPDEEKAVAAIESLFRSRFGESN